VAYSLDFIDKILSNRSVFGLFLERKKWDGGFFGAHFLEDAALRFFPRI
jgi:hypothetical protein